MNRDIPYRQRSRRRGRAVLPGGQAYRTQRRLIGLGEFPNYFVKMHHQVPMPALSPLRSSRCFADLQKCVTRREVVWEEMPLAAPLLWHRLRTQGYRSLPCIGYLCYTEKRSAATTPALLCATPCQQACAHSNQRSTHHEHPPQPTCRSPAPRQLPKNEHAPCELLALCLPYQHQGYKATNRRKKIIADKMSAICPLFQQDAYNEHAGHARLRQRHQVKENDQSNLSKKIR